MDGRISMTLGERNTVTLAQEGTAALSDFIFSKC